MKLKIIFPLIIIATIVASLQCHKHKDQIPTQLPPITQEGKNTFGCKVNGEVWVPYYSCRGLSANPCGELAVDVYRTSSNTSLPLSLSISVGQKKSDNSLTGFLIETKTNQGISSIGNKIDSVTIQFQKPVIQLYYNYNYHNRIEKFEITKLDTVNKIFSGIFECTLYQSPTDSLNITDGRFDLKFSACRCSN